MTLRRQLFLSMTLLFVVLLTASMAIGLYNTRHHLNDQMTAHAQDTATSLGFSMSTAAAEGQSVLMESMVDVLFDRGYYLSIAYRDLQDKPLIERRQPMNAEQVPDWFVRWLSLDIPTGTADVMAGWQRLGTVQVTTNPGFAYRDLWVTFCDKLLLFSIVGVVTYLLAWLALTLLLRPLQRVEQQAAAICERHFIEQTELPRTRELRQVVEAINHMSRKLKDIFSEQLALTESLRAQSYLDPVTGLSNRREFNARLQAVTDSEPGNGGCMMIMQVSDFGLYNLKHGHETGDECLRTIAGKLQGLETGTPDAIVSRRAGADFAIYLPRMDQAGAKRIATQLLTQLAGLDILFGHNIHIGMACCDVLRADHRLLSEADLALRQAQSRGQSSWQLYQEGDVIQIAREARQWYATLNRVLLDRNLAFHFQPMLVRRTDSVVASEVFCRIRLQDKLVVAGAFLPMTERFNLAEAFDRLIIDEVRLRSEATGYDAPLCVNLSPQSINSPEFFVWLTNYLDEHRHFARRLIIETSEYLVRTGAEQLRLLCDMLRCRGARLSLDHFGIHSAAFGYLNSMPLDFLKIDRSFIRDIHLNTDNQFYVQSLIQIAHSCDITILAEGVENPLEWDCLCHLGIDGGQGYFLGKPVDKPAHANV